MGRGWELRAQTLSPELCGGVKLWESTSPGEPVARVPGTLQRRCDGEPSRSGAQRGASSSPREVDGVSPSEATQRATAVRAPRCLSELAIRRASVTLAVALAAVGGQEAGGKGVEAVKAGNALPRRR